MNDFVHLPMFLYKGNRQWQNTIKDWNETELATLFHCLEYTYENCNDIEVIRDIVYLMEKLYTISDIIDTEDLNNNTGL